MSSSIKDFPTFDGFWSHLVSLEPSIERAESSVAEHPANQQGGGGSIPASALTDSIPEIDKHKDLYELDRDGEGWFFPMTPGGAKRKACETLMRDRHYTKSIPSGKSHWFYHEGVIVVFSIPANMNLGKFILKRKCVCWELSRMWGCKGHRKNAMTEAIRLSIIGLKRVEPDVEVLVTFADPNVGHEGFVYRAASWRYTGKSEDPRGYEDADGKFYPRRKFHSGGRCMTKAEIESRGFKQVVRDGKHRFVRGMTKQVRRELSRIWSKPDVHKK